MVGAVEELGRAPGAVFGQRHEHPRVPLLSTRAEERTGTAVTTTTIPTAHPNVEDDGDDDDEEEEKQRRRKKMKKKKKENNKKKQMC